METVKVNNYRNASRAKITNKRAGVYDRADGKGFYIQFAKINNGAEDDMTFCASKVTRGIRYTTISLSEEATLALLAAIMHRIKRKGSITITES